MESDLKEAVISLVAYDMYAEPGLETACLCAEVGSCCFLGACASTQDGCQREGTVTVASQVQPSQPSQMDADQCDGQVLKPPDSPGVYRACYYRNLEGFRGGVPITCSEVFRVTAGEMDACGECEGGNSSCVGCDNVVNSGLEEDVCGECGGDGQSCFGCDGVANSGKEVDVCGECGGNGQSCIGCDGEANSGFKVDSCGKCGGEDDYCQEPYHLAVVGGSGKGSGAGSGEGGAEEGVCVGKILLLRWHAPSNHTKLTLRVMSGDSQCTLLWKGGHGEVPTGGAGDRSPAMPDQGVEAQQLQLGEGFAGCGFRCARGWASFVVDEAALSACGSEVCV